MKKAVRKVAVLTVVVALLFTLASCTTHEHIVGTGAATGYTESAKQWYLLYGLIPLNNVDTKAMSGGAANYKIVTQTTIIDSLLGSLTAGLIMPRTVRVIK